MNPTTTVIGSIETISFFGSGERNEASFATEGTCQAIRGTSDPL
jgi:hypothetical protein